MPRGYEAQGDGGGGSDWLKLTDGDMASCILMEDPFMCGVHRLDDPAQQYGKQILCSKEDLGACAICDHENDYKPEESKRKSTGFYSLFVATIQRKGGQKEELQAMMIMQGGWSLISPFKSAYEAQQFTQETMVGIPFILSREGEGNRTRYNIAMKPGLKIKPDADLVAFDVEAFAIKKMREEWKSLGFTPDGAETEEEDPFNKMPAAA